MIIECSYQNQFDKEHYYYIKCMDHATNLLFEIETNIHRFYILKMQNCKISKYYFETFNDKELKQLKQKEYPVKIGSLRVLYRVKDIIKNGDDYKDIVDFIEDFITYKKPETYEIKFHCQFITKPKTETRTMLYVFQEFEKHVIINQKTKEVIQYVGHENT